MEITKEQYYIALGLFTLASKHMRKVEEYEAELNEMLGLDNGDRVSDEIYTMGGGELERALNKLDFTVLD